MLYTLVLIFLPTATGQPVSVVVPGFATAAHCRIAADQIKDNWWGNGTAVASSSCVYLGGKDD